MSKQTRRAIMRNISWLTQLGFSIAFPMIVCTMGSLWLTKRFGLGSWVILVGVLIGVLSGISCFTGFVRHVLHESRREDEK